MTARTAARALVTQVLKELIDAGNQYDAVIAIGPMIMMKFVCETTQSVRHQDHRFHEHRSWLTVPACAAAAVVTVGGETKFACVDGPDFDGHQVDFDECNAPRRHVQGTGAQRL